MEQPAEKSYIAIDLKSFYASVECVDRGLDPLKTRLVVADESRTEKTICLAVSPALKAYGIPGRARLFEVVQKVRELNRRDPSLKLDYIVARPRMSRYMEVSTAVYEVYLKYAAPEDIHVYSVDEVFIDATAYLRALGMTAREMAVTMIRDVLKTTGITATAGIGTNLYLAKIAMDIVAKHMPADADGVRLAELDELSYRKQLWAHEPLTDFWRVGPGYRKKLEAHGLYTMGDIARCSLGRDDDYYNEELLYRLFGVNAELLIDHAWGYEPCTIAEIKAYKPETNSISQGQVLSVPYDHEKARLIVREMTDLLVLDLVEKHLVTDQIVLTVCYDTENLTDPSRARAYHGPVTTDRYGRKVPKDAHGSRNLPKQTSSTRLILEAMTALYEEIVDPALLVRRVYVVAARVADESEAAAAESYTQLDLFTDQEAELKRQTEEAAEEAREKSRQQAVLAIREKYGKNAILKGMNLKEGATTVERNGQVGGHRA